MDAYDHLMQRFRDVLDNEIANVMQHYCQFFLCGNRIDMSDEARESRSEPLNLYQALAVGMALDVATYGGDNAFRRHRCTAIIAPWNW